MSSDPTFTDNALAGKPDASVLLIDDEQDDLAILERMIRRAPLQINIHAVTSGAAALDYLAMVHGTPEEHLPDLIMLDLNMPLMNGHEVLQALRDDPRYKQIPVCVLTSHADEVTTKRAYEEGANAVVNKSNSRQRFETIVSEIIDFWFKTATRYYMD